MIYLIGGPPRCGKSTLSKSIMATRHIPIVSTDLVRGVLAPLLPELHSAMNGDSPQHEAYLFLPHFVQMGLVLQKQLSDVVIEGVGYFPKDVAQLRVSLGEHVPCCFIGNTKASPELLFSGQTEHTEYTDLTEEQQQSLSRKVTGWSLELRRECEQYDIPFVDVSKTTFAEALNRSEDLLFGTED
jgi:hypothetical protein